MTKYAKGTTVSVSKSQEDIKKLLKSVGAEKFALLDSDDGSKIGCVLAGRRLLFEVPPTEDEKEKMRLWRVLRMRVKMRLEEAQESDISFDEAFMPFIMMPDGKTVSQHIIPAIALAYESGKMPKLNLEYHG